VKRFFKKSGKILEKILDFFRENLKKLETFFDRVQWGHEKIPDHKNDRVKN